MRAFAATLLLMAAAFSFAPTATAHQCASGASTSDCVCPPPNDGQAHQHSSPSGACQAAAGAQQSATPGGASQTPAGGVFVVIAGLAGAAVVAARRVR